MAGEKIEAQEHDIDQQHQRSDADAKTKLLIWARKPERADCVIPEEAKEDDGAIKKIAMQILQDKREFCLAAIVAMRRFSYRAARRIKKKRPVIGFAIVITGHAKAQRESQDQQGRREMPPAKIEQRRVEGREIWI